MNYPGKASRQMSKPQRGVTTGVSTLYLTFKNIPILERIGMKLFSTSGPRACIVDKFSRSVCRITGHRTVSKAFSDESSLYVQGWRPVSYSIGMIIKE